MKLLLIFAIWRGVYWALVGSFFWSIGVLTAHLAAGEAWRGFGGGVSLALVIGLLLAASRLRRLQASVLPLSAAVCAGMFVGLLSRLWLGRTGTSLVVAAGIFVGMVACVPRISVAVHNLTRRSLIGAVAGAVVAGVGVLLPEGLGWTAAGALGGLVLGAPSLLGPYGFAAWRDALEWTLAGAIAGALAGFTGVWLSEHALALPRPFPPLLGLQTGDNVMQWLYHALLWPTLLFAAHLGYLAIGRRWRQRLRARSQPQPAPAAPSD